MSDLFRQSKLLRIKSSDKTSSTDSNTNFKVAFNNLLDLHNVRAISIKSISFPNIFYNIPTAQTFNYFDNTALFQSVSVPAGQYTITTLLAVLKAGVDADITPRTSTFTLDPVTKKVTMAVSTGTCTVTSDTFSSTYLGFTSNLPAGGSVTAQAFPDLLGLKTAYIHSRVLSSQKYIDSNGNQSIIAEVPIVSAFGYLNLYESNSSDEIDLILYKHKTNINYVDISLRDEDGNLLDLGQQEIRMVFKIFYNQ